MKLFILDHEQWGNQDNLNEFENQIPSQTQSQIPIQLHAPETPDGADVLGQMTQSSGQSFGRLQP